MASLKFIDGDYRNLGYLFSEGGERMHRFWNEVDASLTHKGGWDQGWVNGLLAFHRKKGHAHLVTEQWLDMGPQTDIDGKLVDGHKSFAPAWALRTQGRVGDFEGCFLALEKHNAAALNNGEWDAFSFAEEAKYKVCHLVSGPDTAGFKIRVLRSLGLMSPLEGGPGKCK
jgi:hypothetical protein